MQAASNWFSMIYMMITVPVGIVSLWAGQFVGLRASILIAAWTNAIGALIRLSR